MNESLVLLKYLLDRAGEEVERIEADVPDGSIEAHHIEEISDLMNDINWHMERMNV